MATAKSSVKNVEVTILERQYRVACPDDERENLMASVAYLDQKMREIKEAGKIAGQRGHGVIRAVTRLARPVPLAALAPRFMHELAQGHGGAARLCGEPVPVLRQQRHFPRDHAELGTTAALGRWGRHHHGVASRNGFLAATGQTTALATLIARTKGLVLESPVPAAAMPARISVRRSTKMLRFSLPTAPYSATDRLTGPKWPSPL